MHAIAEKNKSGKLIWYGATQDITTLVDYITSIEQILFDISHVIRSPISSMLGLTKMVMENKFNEAELQDISHKLYDTAEEMDRFIRELNSVYIEKRQNTPLSIDFSILIDKRKALFH
jgi:signal transduction histidine kinase